MGSRRERRRSVTGPPTAGRSSVAPGSESAALCALVRADPERGWAAVFDAWGPALVGYARRQVSTSAEADDVVADTFLIAAQRIDQLRDPDAFRSWLFAITRRHVQSRWRDPMVAVDPQGSTMTARSTDDDLVHGASTLAAGDAAALLDAAASGLNPSDRELLALTLGADLDTTEIARITGEKVAAVSVKVNRLRDTVGRAAGALLVARHHRRECEDLDELLREWDGTFDTVWRKRIARHLDGCEHCDDRRTAAVAAFASPLFVAAPGTGLRDQVLERVSSVRRLPRVQSDQPARGRRRRESHDASPGDGGSARGPGSAVSESQDAIESAPPMSPTDATPAVTTSLTLGLAEDWEWDDDGFPVMASPRRWMASWVPVLAALFLLAFGGTFAVLVAGRSPTPDTTSLDLAAPTTVTAPPPGTPPTSRATPTTSAPPESSTTATTEPVPADDTEITSPPVPPTTEPKTPDRPPSSAPPSTGTAPPSTSPPTGPPTSPPTGEQPPTTGTTSSTVAPAPPRTTLRLAPSSIETGCGRGVRSTAVVVVEGGDAGNEVTTISWDGPDAGSTAVSGAGTFEVPIGPFTTVADPANGDAVTVVARTVDAAGSTAQDQRVLTVTQDPSCRGFTAG